MDYQLIEIALGQVHFLKHFPDLITCLQEAARQDYIADGMATFVCTSSFKI